MEVHFVHESADGQLAVVGALMQTGAENLALREMWSNMPMEAGPVRKYADVLINGRDLLPNNRGYHRYMGSLTTTPCSEGVNWFVLTAPLAVGAPQVARFTRAVRPNARPLQALNNRLVVAE
ncbi:MAG: carbonic anhydrase family protein [Alphaproteobacteria bacterium]|nr:carbonic anhydrase family protein [Alphaproteobacteria bacterium]MCZ6813506.1 carbonic anhydrase family protein [Alphaproteobacteria bacterium]